MVLLYNQSTYRYFLVDNTKNKIYALSNAEYRFLLKFEHIFGKPYTLKFKDITSLDLFRKQLLKSINLTTIDYKDTYDYLTINHPEYFI